MTRTDQAQSAATSVAGVVAERSNDDDMRRRRAAGKQTPRRSQRRRTAQNSPVSETFHRTVNDADSDRRTTQRRPYNGATPSRTEAASSSDSSKPETKPCRRIQPSQRTSSRCCVVAANSTYAAAKFTGGAPSASQLPLPPTHWLTVACNS